MPSYCGASEHFYPLSCKYVLRRNLAIPETSLSVSRPEKRQKKRQNVRLKEGSSKSPAWPSAGFLQVWVTPAQQQQCWLAALSAREHGTGKAEKNEAPHKPQRARKGRPEGCGFCLVQNCSRGLRWGTCHKTTHAVLLCPSGHESSIILSHLA